MPELKAGDKLYQVYKHKNGSWKLRVGELIWIGSIRRFGILFRDDDQANTMHCHQHTGALRFGGPSWYLTAENAVSVARVELGYKHQREIDEVNRLIPAEKTAEASPLEPEQAANRP